MTVFASLYANQYDQLYAEKDYKTECDIIELAMSRAGASGPLDLLDVGCGTGGHALELGRRGHMVTGVDLSQAMLDRAIAKSATAGLKVAPRFVQGDARSFNTERQHSAAIMMFAVVGYLIGNDDVLAGLRNIRRHLKAGAPFVCDFWFGPSVLSVRPSDRVRVLPTAAGKVIRSASTTLDVAAQTADVSFQLWTIEKERLVSETLETHKMRYFFPQEFALFLQQSGFELRSISAFPSLEAPVSDQTWNALVVARAV